MQKLFNDDCIEKMSQLAEEGILVDAIITDPPYNISRKNNFHTLKGRKGIDFGEWDKGFEQLKWLESANKLLKPGGSIIVFNDWKNLGTIAKFLEQSYDYEIKDVIRWIKKNPMPRNRDRRYITDYEFAIWLVKIGAKWTFNRSSKTYERPEFLHGLVSGKEKLGHPTQKPLKLMENILKIHTNKNDLILDPFMGSGSTIEAAKNTNRDFIGIELNKKYFNIATKRIGITYIKSPLNYMGGKFKYIDQISKYFPKNISGRFYDVFLGSGEVILNTKYKKSISFEKNKNVYDLFKLFEKNSFEILDKKIKKIISHYSLTISSEGNKYKKILNRGLKDHNQKGYLRLRNNYNLNPSPLKLLVLILYSFNNQIRTNTKGEFNVPVGKSDYNTSTRSKLESICERIKSKKKEIIINNGDFFNFDINKIKKDDFLYFDPPYLITTATYCEGDNWTEIEEKKLISILKKLSKKKIRWCLTNVIEKNGKKNTILLDFIKSENVNYKEIKTNYKNYRRTQGKTKELVIWNYKTNQ